MGALRTGEEHRLARFQNWGRSLHRHLHPLASKQLDTGPTMLSPAPIPPEQGNRANSERMKQPTHAARMLGGLPMPLTLLTQGARTTGTDAGLIDEAQTAIGFPALFVRKEARASRTAQRAVRLGRKVLPREAAHFPGEGPLGRAIPTGGSRRASRFLSRRELSGGSKLGGTRRLRLQLMA